MQSMTGKLPMLTETEKPKLVITDEAFVPRTFTELQIAKSQRVGAT
jgi:hypothetical protein